MALSNYTELRASIADYLNRSDLTSQIPDFIRLAEASFNDREEIIEETFGTLTLQADPVDLPSDCSELLDLYYNEEQAHGQIDLVPPGVLALEQRKRAPTGRPVFASVVQNGTALRLAPIPDQAYVAIVQYNKTIEPLSTAAGGVNWLLARRPDVYLFGALVQAQPFLKEDERIATWQAGLDKALAEMKAKRNRQRFGANTTIQRPRRVFT